MLLLRRHNWSNLHMSFDSHNCLAAVDIVVVAGEAMAVVVASRMMVC